MLTSYLVKSSRNEEREREWTSENDGRRTRRETLSTGFFFQQFTILGPVRCSWICHRSFLCHPIVPFSLPSFFLFVFSAIPWLSTGTVKIAGMAISIPRENGFLDVVVSRLTIPIVPLECDMDRLICRDVCRRGEIYLFASKWWKIR